MSSSVRPVFPRVRKLRRGLTKRQRFERTLAKLPGEDPLFPAIMHSIERHLNGANDLSEMDRICQDAFKQRPLITPEIFKDWVKNWHELSETTKSKFVPRELAGLSPDHKLDMNLFRNTVKRCAGQMRVPWTIAGLRKLAPQYGLRRPNPGFQTVLPPGATITSIGLPPIEEGSTPYGYLGQPFSIYGKDFATENVDNVIVVYRDPADFTQPGITILPNKSTSERLDAVAPPSTAMAPGQYMVQVQVKGKLGSNFVPIQFFLPPSPPAVIKSISPSTQYPGRKVLVSGSGFNVSPTAWWRALDPTIDIGDYFSSTELTPIGTGKEQLEMTIPDRLVYYPAGDYMVAIAGENQGLSNWITVKVLPFKYSVEFTKMECLDESDPEWCGDDELVTNWAIACDGGSWIKKSSEYTGFQDLTEKAYNASDGHVFHPNGGPGEVREGVAIGTLLYEWDEGDAKAWTQAIDAVADIAKKIPVVGDWVSYGLKAISKLISWFGGDPDLLGQTTLAWTTPELWNQTNDTSGTIEGKLDFLNDDDTGSYRLTYRVIRAQP